MKLLQIAIASSNSQKRASAVEKLAKNSNISALVRVLNETIYKDTIEKAELALAKYNFK